MCAGRSKQRVHAPHPGHALGSQLRRTGVWRRRHEGAAHSPASRHARTHRQLDRPGPSGPGDDGIEARVSRETSAVRPLARAELLRASLMRAATPTTGEWPRDAKGRPPTYLSTPFLARLANSGPQGLHSPLSWRPATSPPRARKGRRDDRSDPVSSSSRAHRWRHRARLASTTLCAAAGSDDRSLIT